MQLLAGCVVAVNMFLDDDLMLRPSRSSYASVPFRDHSEPPSTPPSSPMFSKSTGVRLSSAGLRRPLAVLQQATAGSQEPTRRPVAVGPSATPRSVADRDAQLATWKDPALSVDGTVRRRMSLDGISAVSSSTTPAVHARYIPKARFYTFYTN